MIASAVGPILEAGSIRSWPHVPKTQHLKRWRRLIEAFLAQARTAGAVGVHLETTSQNATACRLYERLGFRLLAARPTRLWAGLIAGPVENRCYGMALQA